MDTLLNAEEREFAQQMRQFYRTEIPEELRAVELTHLLREIALFRIQ